MEDDKLCPLEGMVVCCKDRCAWWVEGSLNEKKFGGCAVIFLGGEALRKTIDSDWDSGALSG